MSDKKELEKNILSQENYDSLPGPIRGIGYGLGLQSIPKPYSRKKAGTCPTCGQAMPAAKVDGEDAELEKNFGQDMAGYQRFKRQANATRAFFGMKPIYPMTHGAGSCPTCGQKVPANSDDDDANKADSETDLAKLGQLASDNPIQAAFVAHDMEKMAAAWGNPDTRAHAEACLQAAIDHGEPLRKAFASAWLSRARKTLADSKILAHAKGAAGKAMGGKNARVEQEAGHSERMSAESSEADPKMQQAQADYKNRQKHLRTAAAVAGAGATGAVAYRAAANHTAHGQLSDKQRQERIIAARARWQKAKVMPA